MPDPRIQDFSGGETDRFRDQKDPRFCKLARNLYINENRKLEVRPAYTGFDPDDLMPYGEQTVDKIWLHETRDASVASDQGLEQRYEIFALSSGAVQRSTNHVKKWRTGINPGDGTSSLDSIFMRDQYNYIRINDDEFVVTGREFPVKFYREFSTGEWKFVSLGLPRYDDVPVVFNDINDLPVSGANNYVYALVLKHEYTLFDAGTGFLDKVVLGEPYFQSITHDGAIAPGNLVKVLTPDFLSSLSDYVDNEGGIVSDGIFSTDVVWEIYRTKNDGSILYRVGEIPPGSTFADAIEDSALEANAVLYTTGGVLGNGMANDRALFGTYANDALWLASNNRVWQSKVGIYDAFPGSFNFGVRSGEYITAIEAIDIYPIVFTNRGAYRIEGIVDDLGNGTHRVRTISGAESKGALSNKTTVKADNSIFYLSDDGIYETNGYTSRKVSGHYNDRYCEIIRRSVGDTVPFNGIDSADATYDEKSRRVHWFFPKTGDNFYPQETLTLDTKYPHEEGYAITSGDVPYEVTSVTSGDSGIILSNAIGQVLEQSKDKLTDVGTKPYDPVTPGGAIDSEPSRAGEGTAVLWDYVTCSLSFGSSLIRKWFSRLLINARNNSDLTFAVQSDTDESEDFRDHNPVVQRTESRGFHFIKRGFPKGRLRGTFKQIRLSNSVPQILLKSDDYGLASVSGNTVTLDSGQPWPDVIFANAYSGNSVGGGNSDINNAAVAYRFRYETIPGSGNYASQVITTFNPPSTTLGIFSGVNTANTRWYITASPVEEKMELNDLTTVFAGAGEGHAQSSVEGASNE